jgi:hypothetical protein
LGCGGAVAQRTGRQTQIRSTGVDIRGDQLINGLVQGFNVYQGSGRGLADFPDSLYDYDFKPDLAGG